MEEVILPQIVGEGFILRPFADSDAPSLQRHLNDKRVARDVSNIPHPYSLAHAKAWIEQTSSAVNDRTRRVDFAIERGGEVVGSMAFINLERKNRKAQVSYWLHPDHWGRGIATDALKLLVRFGFDQLELFRIYGYVFPQNRISARVLQKTGFVFEGVHAGEWVKVIDGRPRQFDSHYYALVRRYREKNTARAIAIVTPDVSGYAEAKTYATSLANRLETYGYQVRCDQPPSGECELAVAIGGDGTMMRALRAYSMQGVPTLGVNAGDVGFLTSAQAAEWRDIADVIAGNKPDRPYHVERRLGLCLRKNRELFGPFANEITLRHPDGVASFSISINGEPVIDDLSADGMLVATATGSTAYNASVGGPIIFPSSSNVVISAINPMRLNTRPIVVEEIAVGGTVQIVLTKSKRGLPVAAAADEIRYMGTDTALGKGLAVGESITISRHDCPLLFATFGRGQYIDALKRKKGFAR